MPGQAAPDVKVVHFADPWCWWSWGLEPVLQRLREVYGDRLQVEYRMGGMCEDLDAWMKEYAVDEASTVDWIRESMALFKMRSIRSTSGRAGSGAPIPPASPSRPRNVRTSTRRRSSSVA